MNKNNLTVNTTILQLVYLKRPLAKKYRYGDPHNPLSRLLGRAVPKQGMSAADW